MLAISLALIAALSYGCSDFIGGLVARRTSAWAVAVVGGISSVAFAAVSTLFVSGTPHPADFAWAVVAGIGSGAGVGFLYRGLSSGRMSVVAPVSAVGAALVPTLFGVIGGERPSVWVWAGIAVAVPAIYLVSSGSGETSGDTDADLTSGPEVPQGRATAGLLDGVLAGLGFGLLFGCLGQVPDSAGLAPLALAQLVAVPVIVLLATALGASWLPRERTVAWALLTGPFAGTANLLFLLATQHGFLTVSAVLTSLYPASTVLLAMLVLREQIHRAQAAGLMLCAITVVLVAAG